MNTLKKNTLIILILSVIGGFTLIKFNSTSNYAFENDVLKIIKSNQIELEQVAEGLITINKWILRDSLQIGGQIPNEISIKTTMYEGYSTSPGYANIGIPNSRLDTFLLGSLFEMDSINYSEVRLVKDLCKELEFYNVKIDTNNVVTFKFYRGNAPLEMNTYHFTYNPQLIKDESYTRISKNMYFKTISIY